MFFSVPATAEVGGSVQNIVPSAHSTTRRPERTGKRAEVTASGNIRNQVMIMKFIIMLSLLISGCSATGAFYKDLPALDKDGRSELIVYRLKKFVGGGVCYHVSVDDEMIGILGNGGFIRVLIAPGKHKISFPSVKGPYMNLDFISVANGENYILHNMDATNVVVAPVFSSATFNTTLMETSKTYALEQLPLLRNSLEGNTCMITRP